MDVEVGVHGVQLRTQRGRERRRVRGAPEQQLRRRKNPIRVSASDAHCEGDDDGGGDSPVGKMVMATTTNNTVAVADVAGDGSGGSLHE